MNNTANTSILSESVIYSPQQVGSVGSFPIFLFPGIAIPSVSDIFRKETEKLEIEKLNIPQDTDILELAKKFYSDHKETLLREYKGKYIVFASGQN
ncbi:MAG: hypothetical protein AUK24_08795 [Syntrophaceae bacterium CG2_30_49_12]|nr:MAG: hypothetical protein AUK24_08795 [Syntrophaceae bacterium CG2_30_49_12]PIP07403.1 MAG: hypothetical protein COX52_03825 [Syntrophobacterales bacterium CG23_combo_of_CG06-09_8_20_14_all_48_27]